MKIYIGGPMTGHDDYKQRFAAAEEQLLDQGHQVMNPAVLPEGFEHAEYMRICLAMIDVCDAIHLLPGWSKSKGAVMEFEHAWDTGKAVSFAENAANESY